MTSSQKRKKSDTNWLLSPYLFDFPPSPFCWENYARIETHVWQVQKILGPDHIPLLGRFRRRAINSTLQSWYSLGGRTHSKTKCPTDFQTIRHECNWKITPTKQRKNISFYSFPQDWSQIRKIRSGIFDSMQENILLFRKSQPTQNEGVASSEISCLHLNRTFAKRLEFSPMA